MSITHSLQYGILHLTIDRVERRNALTAEMFADLADELDQAIMQTAVRVVLLKSSGNVFSAGADLEEMFSAPEDLERETRRFFDSIAKFPKPLIAQVSGPCVGEAFAALLYCDLVYVSPQALFFTSCRRFGTYASLWCRTNYGRCRRLSGRCRKAPSFRADQRR